VFGVDDDAVIGGLCDPPLSSVVPDPETIGFRASELLAEAMSRRTTTPSSEEIAPTGLVARGSTDVIALADPRLARAVQTIRMHACGPLVVTRVAHAAGMSRSVLERGFRQVLGISPQTLIRRTRLREVMVLLRDTELSLRDIAQRTGFKHAEHLCTVFKRERDETPGQYRKSSRRRPSTPLLAFAAKDRRPRD
jgi:LacI family transcriptional regulator